jgi:hypothetical protein
MSHYVFSFICNFCNVWMLYIYIYIKKKKPKKWERGVNCEEGMREKNKMGEGDVCVWWGRRKKKGKGYMNSGRKKKKKKKKRKQKEKKNGDWGLHVCGEKKKKGWKKRKKKNLKGKKLN